MLTLDSLRRWGANTQEGLSRCLNNESFYLRLVNMAIDNSLFDALADAVGRNDRKAAFEAAHGLKGALGNLALTPLFTLASEMTELLRADQDADYPAYLARLLEQRDALLALRNE